MALNGQLRSLAAGGVTGAVGSASTAEEGGGGLPSEEIFVVYGQQEAN